MALQTERTVAELRELRELTGDEDGAQRVAWTDTWERAREWLRGKVAGLPVEEEIDEAGNQWFTLPGASDPALLIGGHIDSVPNGGWLDGCLNVVAGAEVLRRIAGEGTPTVTVRLVNWADEEGARFGRSLFGSSAAAGSMTDQDELRQLVDRDGIPLPDALAEHGVDLDRATDARSQLESAAAYLELHIEQGPVLEGMGIPLGAVLGTYGVERHRVTWTGQAAHAGSTPMDRRRDALAGAAKLALEIRDIAARVGDGAVCTSGGVVCKPGIVTSVVETAEQLLDQRHLDADKLAELLSQAEAASRRFAAEENVGVGWEKIWSIEPILFDSELVDMCDAAIEDVAGVSHRLPSGPLHDAAEVARAGIPTVMMFVQSLRGLSHTKLEDTLARAHRALGRGARQADDRGAGLGRGRTAVVAGKTLLVFGARNLGRTLARTLAGDGWNVAAFARSEETIAALRAEVPEAAGFAGDAGSAEDVERAFAETAARFGGVDLVVNAITPRSRGTFGGGSLAEASPDAMEPYVDELLPGIFNVLRVASRVLGEQGHGTIVQVTGGSTRRAMPGRGPWASAAFATRALAQAAALEGRERGVHVALLIVDATIESDKTRDRLDGPKEGSTSEADVVAAITYLESQSPRAWTHELQITPRLDRWVP